MEENVLMPSATQQPQQPNVAMEIKLQPTEMEEEKYKQLKHKLKDVLYENSRLSDKLDKYRNRNILLIKEKELLLERLLRNEEAAREFVQQTLTHHESDNEISDVDASQDTALHFPNPLAPTAATTPHVKKKPKMETNTSDSVPKRVRRNRKVPVVVKTRKVQPVPCDDNGNPILPFQVGILTLHNLGTIVYDREMFHNERYLYPVGYTVSREYYSMKDPEKIAKYVCTIRDNGQYPQFIVTADDAPDEPVVATSATGAWTHIIRIANSIRNREHSNSASGPDYFGFTQPTIAHLIQELPNVHLCKDYVKQHYELITKGVGKKLTYKADKKLIKTKKSDLLSTSDLGQNFVTPEILQNMDIHNGNEIEHDMDVNEDEESEDEVTENSVPAFLETPVAKHNFDVQMSEGV